MSPVQEIWTSGGGTYQHGCHPDEFAESQQRHAAWLQHFHFGQGVGKKFGTFLWIFHMVMGEMPCSRMGPYKRWLYNGWLFHPIYLNMLSRQY